MPLLTNNTTSPKMVYDSSGALVWAPHNVILRSNDLSTTWTSGGVTLTGNSGSTPSGQPAYLITSDTSNGVHNIAQVPLAFNLNYPVTVSIYIKADGASGIHIQIYDPFTGSDGVFVQFDFASETTSSPSVYGTGFSNASASYVSLSGGWYRISLTLTPKMITHLVTAFYMLQLVSGSSTGWTGTAAEKLLFGGAQLNKGSSTLDFVITGADAKVTTALDYHPTSHASLGALIEPQRTNYLLNSGTPATQSVSLGAGTYTLWIAGSGSCVLSGGPTGTATAGSPATFTLGSTTSVTFTISGTVTRFQVELGLEPTSFIPTTSAQVTRAADLPQLSISSIPTVNNVSWSAYVNAVLIGKGGTAGQAPLSIGTADGSDDAAITWAGVSTPLTQYSSGGVNSAIGAPTV